MTSNCDREPPCGRPVHSHSDGSRVWPPIMGQVEPGGIAACGDCGKLFRFSELMALQPMTKAEEREALAERPELRAAVERLRT